MIKVLHVQCNGADEFCNGSHAFFCACAAMAMLCGVARIDSTHCGCAWAEKQCCTCMCAEWSNANVAQCAFLCKCDAFACEAGGVAVGARVRAVSGARKRSCGRGRRGVCDVGV